MHLPCPIFPTLPTLVLCSLFLAPACDALHADDFKTLSGKVFHQAEVTALTESTVTLRHTNGTTQVFLSEFSGPDQRRFRELEILRRSAEVERLKLELQQRQAELDSLREIQDRLQPLNLPPTHPAAGSPSPPNTPPAIKSPQPIPPDPQEVVAIRDLVLAFNSEPAAANARFRGRRFRIRGIVQGFQSKAFLRDYSVQLDSGDPRLRVTARFSYRSDWKAVYPAEDGRRLVARLGEQQRTLLQSGDEVIFLGTCEGFRNGGIVFSGCAQETPPLPARSSPRR